MTEEEGSMDAYRELKDIGDPVVAVLMDLVLEDEAKHHELLRRMALRLRDDIDMTRTPDALAASPAGHHGGPDVAAVIRTYANEEREGAKLMRRIAKEEHTLYGGVFSMLLDVMARDSEKHEAIMRFILSRLDEPT